MARFKVGDRVQTTVGHMACEVIAGPDPDGIYAIRHDEGFLFMRSGYGLEQVPPPDPRDAVVEAAVAYCDGLRGTSALYDAVQAYREAQP